MTSTMREPSCSDAPKRLAWRERSRKKGTKKCPNTIVMPSQPQPPFCRWWKKSVSSGMFAYQMRKYCENEMYAQNTVNAKSSLPRSWKWCSVTSFSSSPTPRMREKSRLKKAMIEMTAPAKM